jgi:hypothetical protein
MVVHFSGLKVCLRLSIVLSLFLCLLSGSGILMLPVRIKLNLKLIFVFESNLIRFSGNILKII